MVSLSQVFVRGLQFLWTILITALIGNVIASSHNSPASVNFAMFVAALSWIVLLYGLVAAFVESLAIPFVLVVLDTLATLFTFVAAVVLSARLHVHSCTNAVYLVNNSLIRVSDSPQKTCRELQASTAFFWFLFITFAVSLALSLVSSKGSFSSGRSARSGPAMTQV